MPEISLDNAGNLFTGVSIYLAMVLAASWLAMIIWAYRDMRARSRDLLAQLLVAVVVALLTLPGLVIYLFLRPRETLAEAYERSLEEEALLQEIEEKPTCPGCKQRVQDDWQACPYCHTRLKKACVRCNQMLDLSWNLCPYCATPQPAYATERAAVSGGSGRGGHTHARPSNVPEYQVRANAQPESLFVDGEE